MIEVAYFRHKARTYQSLSCHLPNQTHQFLWLNFQSFHCLKFQWIFWFSLLAQLLHCRPCLCTTIPTTTNMIILFSYLFQRLEIWNDLQTQWFWRTFCLLPLLIVVCFFGSEESHMHQWCCSWHGYPCSMWACWCDWLLLSHHSTTPLYVRPKNRCLSRHEY